MKKLIYNFDATQGKKPVGSNVSLGDVVYDESGTPWVVKGRNEPTADSGGSVTVMPMDRIEWLKFPPETYGMKWVEA